MVRATGIRLSVVVAAYNEVSDLSSVLEELLETLAFLGPALELLIVDDGSSDGTGAVADGFAAADPRVRVTHHLVNRGIGGVYRSGFEQARGDLITFFPADGQAPATIARDFLPLTDDADLVLGYVEVRTDSQLGRFLSAGKQLLMRLLFGPVPRFQTIMMVRRSLLEVLPLRTQGRGAGIIMELMIRAARGGYRVRSVLTELRSRRTGQSKVNNLRTVWVNFVELIKIRLALSGW